VQNTNPVISIRWLAEKQTLHMHPDSYRDDEAFRALMINYGFDWHSSEMASFHDGLVVAFCSRQGCRKVSGLYLSSQQNPNFAKNSHHG
jgi:hypothetical protein